jgi:hypothetical protein
MAPSNASRSSRLTLRRGLFACAFALVVPLGACGQVTGLSEDYRFDQLADGGTLLPDSGQGSAPGTDGGPGDANGGSKLDVAPDARETCASAARATATTELTNAGAEPLSACTTCLATNCCASVGRCATSNVCNDSMKCVYGCQNKQPNPKIQCLGGCSNTFEETLKACIESACASSCSLF